MRIFIHIRSMICAMTLLTSFQVTADIDHSESQSWTIVNYWSITCAPCRIEIPELNQLHLELETVGIELVGVNFDEDERERTLMLADRMGIEFPTLRQAQVDALGVVPPSVLPTTLIISPEGIEEARLIGAQTGNSIKASLKQLLGARE